MFILIFDFERLVRLSVMLASIVGVLSEVIELGAGLRGVMDGAAVSMIQLRLAGLASILPAVSMALTFRVWGPPLREEKVWVELQAFQPKLSRLHWKAGLVSEELKEKLGEVLLVRLPSAGPEEMVVSGAVVSEGFFPQLGVTPTSLSSVWFAPSCPMV